MPKPSTLGFSPVARLHGEFRPTAGQLAPDPPEQPGEGRLADPSAVHEDYGAHTFPHAVSIPPIALTTTDPPPASPSSRASSPSGPVKPGMSRGSSPGPTASPE